MVKNFCRGFSVAALVLVLASCATVGPIPKVNLQEPGWTVRQGQAVWHLEHGSREVAGDLMVAIGPDERAFVQFSKTPFALVIAQSTKNQWAIEFPPQNKHFAGRGKPPERLIWLYLPRALLGRPLPAHWTWQDDGAHWRLENAKTAEFVEGYFNQ
jgi:hypothetical protein